MNKTSFDTIIIGAGAAGLMCAQIAASFKKNVLLIDHSHKLAEKIRISGGGRCNFTNISTNPEAYLSKNPHFCISALSGYTPYDFIDLLNQYNIPYHEKTLGQLFCDNSAEDIINLLDHLCKINQVTRKMSTCVENVEKSALGFNIITNNGSFQSETLVIATGGLSIPQIGATGFGYNIARQFGLNIIKTAPALVPLALAPKDLEYFLPLAGNSFFSKTTINKISFEENTLITHRGLSGPAILQISSYLDDHNKQFNIDMLPNNSISQLINNIRRSNKLLNNFLAQFFSERMANSLCTILKLNKQICQLSNDDINKINNLIHSFVITPSGNLGYKKAEVTKGGVDTQELSSKTMMSHKIAGLFFIGEVVDVTGWLGGYNFQWAWSSAYAASNSL